MSFSYSRAETVDDIVKFLSAHPKDGKILAGGTDLNVQLARGQCAPAHLMDVRAVEELGAITIDDEISIGACVTHGRIEQETYFKKRIPALVEGCRVVGGWQVRNVGTVGGNLVNASPAADVTPVLMVLDAIAHYRTSGGDHKLSLHEFLRDRGETALGQSGVLKYVTFANPAPGTGTSFLKAGRRRAMEISVVNVAVRVTLTEEDKIGEVRIIAGAVGPVPFRSIAAEKIICGRQPDETLLRQAAIVCAEGCTPRDDVRASAEYRRHMVNVNMFRALNIAVERARKDLNNE